MTQQRTEGMLSPNRVLDLAEDGCMLCSKVLGDLGADVIKIEPPGGSPTRNTGPFYHDIPDPEKSLTWFFLGLNKRGITLNLETADGRELFKRLADLIRVFVDQKVDQIQINVVSSDTLRAAQKEPDEYKDLVVKVAGYNARFVDLYKELQGTIIARTEHGL